MEPIFLVCESEASYERLVTLFGLDFFFPIRFDDGKVIVRLVLTKQGTLLLDSMGSGVTRLPMRFASTPLNDIQLAALPAKVRNQLPETPFMRDFFDVIRKELPHESSFERG